MKKKIIFLMGVLCASTNLFSQENSLPNVGKVGIGTTSPTETLEVNGNVQIDSSLFVHGDIKLVNPYHINQDAFSSGNYNVLIHEISSGKIQEIDYASYQNVIRAIAYGTPPLGTSCEENSPEVLTPTWENGVKKLFVPCPSVKVGVGVTNPLYSLHVNGNGHFVQNIGVGTDPNVNAQVNVLTSRKVGYCVDHTYGGDYGYAFKGILHKETAKGIGIYNEIYQKDIFTVYGNGKIEVSNDAGKILQLESNGLLRARSIRVDLNAWADYVFDKNYVLRSLSDVENYITENGHLPNIPSSEDMIKEGMDISEMSRLLLEKIEELTLYSIDQNKKITELEQRLRELEQKAK